MPEKQMIGKKIVAEKKRKNKKQKNKREKDQGPARSKKETARVKTSNRLTVVCELRRTAAVA